ncbi:MAG: phage tail tip lysozyme [Candidatus Saccharimonas sp.]
MIKLKITKNKSILKTNLLVLVSLFMVIGPPAEQVYAIDSTFYSQNNLIIYDPGSNSDASNSSCSGSTTLSGKDNLEKIWNYLIQKGLSNTQVAGVLGNIQVESGFSPTRQEIAHSGTQNGGWGLVQWTGGRRTQLRQDIKEKNDSLLIYESNTSTYGGAVSASSGYALPNIPVADNDALLAIELDFLYNESISRTVSVNTKKYDTVAHHHIEDTYSGMTEWDAIKSAPTIEDASDIWLFSFERPADQTTNQTTRANNASKILENATGYSPSDSTGTSCATGNFAQTVLKFALPEYHPATYAGADKAMPDYVKAADEARANKYYVGDGAAPTYADCGGFITTLMHSSGYDPTYNTNSDGKGGGPTQDQFNWLMANWNDLGPASNIDVGTLQPGDVWVTNGSGHTFVYVGDIPGFSAKAASASQNDRVPMADNHQSLTSDQQGAHWFRKK